MLTFTIVLLFIQFKFIASNKTTSEYITRNLMISPDYNLSSVYLNINQWFKNPLSFKNNFDYNENSIKLLDKNITISQYIEKNRYNNSSIYLSDNQINKSSVKNYSFDKESNTPIV